MKASFDRKTYQDEYNRRYMKDPKHKAEAAARAKRRSAYLKSLPVDNPTRLKARWSWFKHSSKDRGIDILFTFERWAEIVIGALCHYCGMPVETTGGALDRIDSSLPYTVDNVVPCCPSCNLIKGEDNISYEEMLYIIPLLIEFRRRIKEQ